MCTLQLIRAETSIQYSSQIRAIVHNDHQKIIFLFMLLLFIHSLFLGLYVYIFTQNKTNILGLTRQQKIAWKSGRKFILKFSPQADFNFVQPWLGQLSMTIFSKFWSRDHYPICIHGSRSRCFTCIAEQVTSEVVVDMFSRGGRDCHFVNTSVEMAKFVRAAVQLQRQCFINPLFLIIAVAATSAAVSWQFAGWISPIPPRLYSTAVNIVWCLQCGQMF